MLLCVSVSLAVSWSLACWSASALSSAASAESVASKKLASVVCSMSSFFPGFFGVALMLPARVSLMQTRSCLRRSIRDGRLLIVRIACCLRRVSPMIVDGYLWCVAPT